MPSHDLQTSFNGGVVSPRLFGRTDASIYDIAVAEMVNFAPTIEGPAIKRSGTLIIGQALASASAIIPFEFNSTQAYVIEFDDYEARFYTNTKAPLLDGSGNQVIITGLPYSASDAYMLDYQQSADVLYLAHPNYPPAKISRVSATSFVYSVLALTGGPFADENADRTINVYASAGDTIVGAEITLTASSAIFQPGHIGGFFQLQALDFADYYAWNAGMSTAIGDICRSDGKLYQNINGNRMGTTAPTHTIGAESDGHGFDSSNVAYGSLWQYVCDQYGQVQITGTGSSTGLSDTATGVVTRRLVPDLTNSAKASWRWNFGRFSVQNGWPTLVRIWNNRIVFFTDYEVIGSVVGDYLNFSAQDDTGRLTADLAFRFRINGSNPIRWAVIDLQMMIGTDRGEWLMGAINSAEAPSSTNMQLVRQSHYGGMQVRPIQADTRTLFVQRGGKKIRESTFDYTQNRFVAPNLTVWCRHLAIPGITRMAWQQEAEEILWCIRKDGQLLMHALSPEQQVKGWAIAPIAGPDGSIANVIDLCVIPSSDGAMDMVWMLVERDGIKTIEVMADWWQDGGDIAQGIFLDGAITYSGMPAQVIGVSGTGFPPAMAGKTVSALADGRWVQELTIASDGSVTLDAPSSTVCVGFDYGSWITALPARLPSHSGGAGELKKKRLKSMLMRVVDTIQIWASQIGASRSEEMFRRSIQTAMDTPMPLVSGVSDEIGVGGNTDRTGQWKIESRGPYPAIMSMVRASFTTEDKD